MFSYISEEKRNVEIANAQASDIKAQLQLKDHQMKALQQKNTQISKDNEALLKDQVKNSKKFIGNLKRNWISLFIFRDK